jgi:hypothetical protein
MIAIELVTGFASMFSGGTGIESSSSASEVSSLAFLSVPAPAGTDLSMGMGMGLGLGGDHTSPMATPQAEATPSYSAEALAAARLLRLKRAAGMLLSIGSAVSEKEELISEAVGRDDFEQAGGYTSMCP